MLTELIRNEHIMKVLALYSQSEWERVAKALLTFGARQLSSTFNLKDLTVRQMERIAYEGSSPRRDMQPVREELAYSARYVSNCLTLFE